MKSHVDVGGEDHNQKQYQSVSRDLPRFAKEHSQSTQYLEEPGYIREFIAQGKVRRYDGDIEVRVLKMIDAREHEQ